MQQFPKSLLQKCPNQYLANAFCNMAITKLISQDESRKSLEWLKCFRFGCLIHIFNTFSTYKIHYFHQPIPVKISTGFDHQPFASPVATLCFFQLEQRSNLSQIHNISSTGFGRFIPIDLYKLPSFSFKRSHPIYSYPSHNVIDPPPKKPVQAILQGTNLSQIAINFSSKIHH